MRQHPRSVPSDPVASVDLVAALERHLDSTRLIGEGDRILIALSGGLDSVVLLHLIRRFAPARRLDIHAGHFDHAMRPDSAEHADRVASLCREWSVPLVAARAPVAPRGEAAARTARYAFLNEAADHVGADRIATAHHADDQAETVLFRLIRGTGLYGLRGIPARRGRIIRPLLPFRRSRIAAHATAWRLSFLDDPSNLDPRFARNRIRHEVLPLLDNAAPGTVTLLLDLAHLADMYEQRLEPLIVALELRIIQSPADGTLQLARESLLAYHPDIRARVLRRALRRLGHAPARRGTRAALDFMTAGASGGRLDIGGGIQIERAFDRLILKSAGVPASGAPDRPLRIPAPGDGHGEAIIGGKHITVRWSLATAPDDAWTASFDPTVLRFPLVLRGRQPGDRIWLGYGRKKLKKLFAERRLARSERGRVPILADAAGHVLWVVGHARAAGVRPASGSSGLSIAVGNGEPG